MSTDTADRREMLRRMSNEARDLNVVTALDLLVEHADDATLASLIAGPLPEGFVAVPVGPTDQMTLAGSYAADALGTPLTRTANAYRAMLAARPQNSP